MNNLENDPVSTSQQMFRLDGKTAIVTGASSGLGQRFVSVLHEAGANVVLAARRAERMQGIINKLVEVENHEPNGSLAAMPCDITETGTPAALVDYAIETFGSLDIVVNNAGISRVLAATDDSVDDFRYEIEINLVAPYEIARHAAKAMLGPALGPPQTGSVINIGSILGAGGGGRLKAPGYAASKGGIHNLTRELASQWARKGIRVNAIAPGWFETEMNEEMFGTDGGMRYITENTPMGRPGFEGELDGALLFLASDAASYVTGQVLFVDGGWSAI